MKALLAALLISGISGCNKQQEENFDRNIKIEVKEIGYIKYIKFTNKNNNVTYCTNGDSGNYSRITIPCKFWEGLNP